MNGPSSIPTDFETLISNINAQSFTTESYRKNALNAARSLCHRLERPMESMLRIAWIEPSYTACLKIALDVGVFQALADGGEHSVENLASYTLLRLQ